MRPRHMMRTSVVIMAASTLAGCYDLKYLDKQGVVQNYGSYDTSIECEGRASFLTQVVGTRAWCDPDWMEEQVRHRKEASK